MKIAPHEEISLKFLTKIQETVKQIDIFWSKKYPQYYLDLICLFVRIVHRFPREKRLIHPGSGVYKSLIHGQG